MRRLKNTLFARLVGKATVASLLLNYLGLVIAPTAEAQLTGTLPQWAVVDFANRSGLGDAGLGGAAADAFATNLAGTNKVNLVSRESVERGYKELGLTPPVTRDLDVIRLGQWLQVEVVFIGEVQQARINKGANGKSADVVLIVRGVDISSGLPIMGTAVAGQSAEMPGDVSDDVLLAQAADYAAQKGVQEVMRQQLQVATVIGTPSDKDIKLNKGARDGLKPGMEMVVTRGREQVGIIRVTETDPDMADAVVVREYKGVAPGDKARAIFSKLPQIQLTSQGPRVRSVGRKIDTSSALIALLVVGALAALVAKQGGDTTASKVTAEAGLADDNVTPASIITWHPNIFAGGARTRVEWHIWRTDVQDNPVGVAIGTADRFLDTPFARTVTWRNFEGRLGSGCPEDPGTEEATGPGVIPGTTYFYQLSLVFAVSCLDVPGGCGSGEVRDCFFNSGRANAAGGCTPLTRPQPLIPQNGASDVSSIVQFTFTSTPGANEYCVELSTSPTFSVANEVVVLAKVQSLLVGSVSTDPIDISGRFPGVQRLYWRVGARNLSDRPGPVKDVLGQRYVFSAPSQFDRVTPPPPPPVKRKGGG